MAAITNTYTRFDAKGVREDLSNVIYQISPEETPFMSNVGRENVTNTFYEWQTDDLAAAITTNAQIEGDDITSFTVAVAAVKEVMSSPSICAFVVIAAAKSSVCHS